MFIVRRISIGLFAFLFLICWNTYANKNVASDLKEVRSAILNNDIQNEDVYVNKVNALKYVVTNFIIDSKINNFINTEVLEKHDKDLSSPRHLEILALYSKVLALTGMAEYKPAIELIRDAPSYKLNKYGTQSLYEFGRAERLRRFEATSEYDKQSQYGDALPYVPMLYSMDPAVVYDGVRKMKKNKVYYPVLMEILENDIEAIALNGYAKIHWKTFTVMTDLFGSGGTIDHEDTLTKILLYPLLEKYQLKTVSRAIIKIRKRNEKIQRQNK